MRITKEMIAFAILEVAAIAEKDKPAENLDEEIEYAKSLQKLIAYMRRRYNIRSAAWLPGEVMMLKEMEDNRYDHD